MTVRRGNRESISLFKQVGSFSSVSRNICVAHKPLKWAENSEEAFVTLTTRRRSGTVLLEIITLFFSYSRKRFSTVVEFAENC